MTSLPITSEPFYIKITDVAPCWAIGTTGGGTDLSKAVKVTNMRDFQAAVKGNNAKIVLVDPGTYDGFLEPGANTTIIGTKPGVMISGGIKINGEGIQNIIIRNLAVRCKQVHGTTDGNATGDDAISIKEGPHHIWIDHVDVSDGQDGNLDITNRSDYVTCSWCKFYYTYDKEHSFSNLINGSDANADPPSFEKVHVTYMNCMWGERVFSRQPRGSYAYVHMINNYHKNTGHLHGVGNDMSIIAEKCYYDVPNEEVFFSMGTHIGWKGIGNEGSAKGMNNTEGKVFVVPYTYKSTSASVARDLIMSSKSGAGNKCYLKMK